MNSRILFLFLTTFMIIIFIVFNINLLDLRHIKETYYRTNHKEPVIRVFSNAGENSGQNDSNV